MVLYDYLCAVCGPFEVRRPIGTAESREGCPACGRPAERKYNPPVVTSPRSALNHARETAERSTHEPRVLGGRPPSAAHPLRKSNPLHAKLPRP